MGILKFTCDIATGELPSNDCQKNARGGLSNDQQVAFGF